MTGMTILFIASLLLLAIAVGLTRNCGVWNTSDDGRCRNPAAGPFNRCHLHQWLVTIPDFVAFVLGIIAVTLLIRWFNDDGLAELVNDIQRWTAAL